MTPPSTSSRTRPTRGRRAGRPSGDERELAILATAERLLAARPLSEISIDDLTRGAGISRPTFYFYFPSKDAVLLTLLDRMVAEMNDALRDVIDRPEPDPRAHWRAAINAFFTVAGAHRAVAVATVRSCAENAEVRALWGSIMGNWIKITEEAILAERARGAAPPGTPAHELATVLNLMNERVMYATFADIEPRLAESDVVDTLLPVWLNSIYQTTEPPPA